MPPNFFIMPIKPLERYYEKRINRLATLLYETVEEDSPGYFHDVRVEIKKIRAFYALVKSCHRKFRQKKYSGSLQKVFKAAGRVRDPQVRYELLLKHRILSTRSSSAKQLLEKTGSEK